MAIIMDTYLIPNDKNLHSVRVVQKLHKDVPSLVSGKVCTYRTLAVIRVMDDGSVVVTPYRGSAE